MRRVLVTGGAGFIGSHVVEALLGRGDDVVALDSFDPFYPRERKTANLRTAQAHPRFRLVEGDIRDLATMRDVFARFAPHAVVHLAAKAGVRPSVEDPAGYVRTNIDGTLNVLLAAAEAKVGRVVFGSSSSIYGNTPVAPFSEDGTVPSPVSPYGATKLAGEALTESFAGSLGLTAIALRFFTVYGPRQRPDLAIHKFARAIRAGQAVTIYGDGGMERDYTFVGDIVEGILASLDYEAFPDASRRYRVFNLGSDRPIDIRTLVAAIGRTVGREADIRHAPVPPGDVQRTWADLTRSRKELGYHPRTSLDEGLARFNDWLGEVEERS